MLAVTGGKDLQVPPGGLDTMAATVPGGATVHRIPDLTHTLRRQPGQPSLSAYRKELREPVNRDLLDTVVLWCREVTGFDQR